MVEGDGNASWDSVEQSELAGELGGGLLDSGVCGGVKIHGVFLIFFTHFDTIYSQQYIAPQIPINAKNTLVPS